MRSNSQAFRLEHNLLEGIQTAMAMSPDQNWLVSGTSSGVLTCWDLRFQLPIVTCTHPAESRIRQLTIPRSGKTVYQNSKCNLFCCYFLKSTNSTDSHF